MNNFSWQAIWDALPYLLHGAALTVIISVTAMVLAAIIGMAAAIFSQTRNRILRTVIRIYVEVFRNTPLLIQLFIVYFGLPQIGIKLSPFLSGMLTLTFYASAYNVEIFRAGLEAVPRGQREAARATGLSPAQEALYVIIPQALRISFPALGNNLVSLVKNSSLVSTIGMVDLMFVANDISANNFRSFEMYATALVLYVIIILVLTRLIAIAELRLLPGHKR
jgi:His/Glu/Gln/Arg/opine family amino acid ABC transporter permease subunit